MALCCDKLDGAAPPARVVSSVCMATYLQVLSCLSLYTIITIWRTRTIWELRSNSPHVNHGALGCQQTFDGLSGDASYCSLRLTEDSTINRPRLTYEQQPFCGLRYK